MKNMGNDIVLFMDGNIQLEVPVSRDGESVWLSANQMAVLFDKDETNIRKHINNVFRSSEVDKNNNTQKMRVDGVKQPVAFYSLDVILAVGYRVNSQRGIAFRKWANNVLKQFILKGYAINEKRLQALKKTVDIQSRMLADALEIEENRSESPFCCLPIITIGVVDYRHCNQKNLKIYLSTLHKSV